MVAPLLRGNDEGGQINRSEELRESELLRRRGVIYNTIKSSTPHGIVTAVVRESVTRKSSVPLTAELFSLSVHLIFPVSFPFFSGFLLKAESERLPRAEKKHAHARRRTPGVAANASEEAYNSLPTLPCAPTANMRDVSITQQTEQQF